jgi:hypothetical protein
MLVVHTFLVVVMRGRRWLALGFSLALAVPATATGQAALRPTIFIDGHVALDTILSIALTKTIHTTLTDLLRGTGVGLASLFTPTTDTPAQPFTGDISEIAAAAKIRKADIVIEMNAMRSQNGNMFLAPTIILRHGSPVDMPPVSGLSADGIAHAIANRIAKDSTRLRRLAADDARADSVAGAFKKP